MFLFQKGFNLRVVFMGFELVFVAKVTVPLLWFGRTYIFVWRDLGRSQAHHILGMRGICFKLSAQFVHELPCAQV